MQILSMAGLDGKYDSAVQDINLQYVVGGLRYGSAHYGHSHPARKEEGGREGIYVTYTFDLYVETLSIC